MRHLWLPALLAIACVGTMGAEPPISTAPAAGTAPEAGVSSATGTKGRAAEQLHTLLAELVPEGRIEEIGPAGVRINHPDGRLLIAWHDLPPRVRPSAWSPTTAVPGPAQRGWVTPAPGYPFRARKNLVEGTLQLLLLTDRHGRIARAIACTGLDPALDDHVLQFVRREWSGPPLTVRLLSLEFQLRD